VSGHLDGPPPGPPDPPYIPGDLGAPSAKEFARRRAGLLRPAVAPAASPDPRVPSGLPIGYGGPTVKSDPVALLAQVKAIVDEQLDEREGFGPWRRDQFMRIDALLRDVSPAVSPDERLREAAAWLVELAAAAVCEPRRFAENETELQWKTADAITATRAALAAADRDKEARDV